MIMKCKFCNGSGRIADTMNDVVGLGGGRLCPACKGAGEFEITIPREKITTCKFCGGAGIEQPSTIAAALRGLEVCPACKGIGIIQRPIVGPAQTGANEISTPQLPRLAYYDYDIAVSFAGEDREIVQQYCDILSSNGLKVFYDKYEKIGLWGANLYDKFDEIYRTKALFCVIFISKYYATKVWTNHERKAAQARALQENREYVLPVRVDDTEIPGISSTTGYVDLRQSSIKELSEMTIQKVKQLRNKTTSFKT